MENSLLDHLGYSLTPTQFLDFVCVNDIEITRDMFESVIHLVDLENPCMAWASVSKFLIDFE